MNDVEQRFVALTPLLSKCNYRESLTLQMIQMRNCRQLKRCSASFIDRGYICTYIPRHHSAVEHRHCIRLSSRRSKFESRHGFSDTKHISCQRFSSSWTVSINVLECWKHYMRCRATIWLQGCSTCGYWLHKTKCFLRSGSHCVTHLKMVTKMILFPGSLIFGAFLHT
jgi:hypothetical protein